MKELAYRITADSIVVYSPAATALRAHFDAVASGQYSVVLHGIGHWLRVSQYRQSWIRSGLEYGYVVLGWRFCDCPVKINPS